MFNLTPPNTVVNLAPPNNVVNLALQTTITLYVGKMAIFLQIFLHVFLQRVIADISQDNGEVNCPPI